MNWIKGLLFLAGLLVDLTLCSASATAQEAAESLRDEHMSELPINPETAEYPRDVASRGRDSSARRMLRSVFGQSFSVPLATRRAFSVPRGARRGQLGDGSPGDSFDPECEVDCILFGNGEARFIIYTAELAAFPLLLAGLLRKADSEACWSEVLSLADQTLQERRSQSCYEAARRQYPVSELLATEPQQFVWVNPLQGSALSFETIAAGSEATAFLEMATALAERSPPDECLDYTVAGFDLIVSACGMFKRHFWNRTEFISYCRIVIVPDGRGPPEECVPLFRNGSAGWEYAVIAGRYIPIGSGGGDVSTCSFQGEPNQLRAQQIASGLQGLFGGSLRVAPRRNGSFLIWGSRLNVNFAAVTRSRPWGYIELVMRLQRIAATGARPDEAQLSVSMNYLISARRMGSQADGGGAREDEAQAVENFLWRSIQGALRQAGINPQQLICED